MKRTRTGLAALVGAAAVAGMLLAGCAGATGTDVDHALALAGTWTRAAREAELSLQVAGQTEEVKIPVQRSITVTVTRTAKNAGTVALAMMDAPDRDSAAFSQLPPAVTSLVPASIPTTATGTLESTPDVLKITVSEIPPPELPAGVSLPAAGLAAGLKGTTLRLNYRITGNEIALSGGPLVLLQVTASATEKLVLTKQAGG